MALWDLWEDANASWDFCVCICCHIIIKARMCCVGELKTNWEKVCIRWYTDGSPCLSKLLADFCKFAPFVGSQTMWALCVLFPSSLWIIQCRVQSDPEHHPVWLMHDQACVSAHCLCLWARSYTLITGNTGWGAERQACCVHMTAQCCGRRREWEMRNREREREWGLWCRAGKAEERGCKYRKLHAVESR